MKLLEADQVKNEKSKAEADKANRIARLNAEEVASTKRLNDALERERIENQRIEEAKKVTAPELEVQKVVLLNEITFLEERKQKALEPIHEKEKEAEQIFKQATETRAIIEKIREDTEDLRETYERKIDALADRETAAVEKDHDLDRRESAVEASEREIKRSTDELAKKWVDYHKHVHDTNDSFAIREQDIENGKKTNAEHQASIDRKEKEQIEKDRELQDRYETLGKAIEEAKKNYNISI